MGQKVVRRQEDFPDLLTLYWKLKSESAATGVLREIAKNSEHFILRLRFLIEVGHEDGRETSPRLHRLARAYLVREAFRGMSDHTGLVGEYVRFFADERHVQTFEPRDFESLRSIVGFVLWYAWDWRLHEKATPQELAAFCVNAGFYGKGKNSEQFGPLQMVPIIYTRVLKGTTPLTASFWRSEAWGVPTVLSPEDRAHYLSDRAALLNALVGARSEVVSFVHNHIVKLDQLARE